VRWFHKVGSTRPQARAGEPMSLAGRAARDPMTVGLVLLTVAIMAFYTTRLGGLHFQIALFWLVQPALDLMLFMIARGIARSPAIPPVMHRFWRAFSYAGLIFSVGDSVQAAYAIYTRGKQAAVPGTFQTACFVIGVAWVAWVMLTYPSATRTRRERVRFWLDSATVLVTAAVFAWTVTVKPSLTIAGVGQLIEILVGNALLIAAAFAAGKLVLGGNAPVTRAAALPAIVGILLQGVLTPLTPANLDSRYLNVMLGLRLLPSVLVVIGPRLQELQLRGDPETVIRRRAKRFSKLPYVMIAGTYVMLYLVLPAGLSLQATGVLVGVVVISALVVGRQLLAFTDNANLLEQLDASLRELSRHEKRFRSLVQHASDMTSVVDAEGRITYLSPSVERVLGYPAEKAVGHKLAEYLHPDDRAELAAKFAQLMANPGSSITHQGRYRHADGSWRWMDVISTNLLGEPSVEGIVSNGREITEMRQLHDQLRYQASHDGLTGLANRGLFTERLAAATEGSRHDDGPVTIMLIDLDEFKAVNDTLGHHVGDAVLVAVAERMRACVRASDTPARLGGDEFAVLLPGTDYAIATVIAQRFLDLLAQPLQVHGHLLTVRASIGIAAARANDPDALLRSADAAMYAAKRTGKGRYAQAVPATASDG
jgi:diguanylate cyclase (GGDEF)-like protein/PAS domain S-box-containing protein